MRPLLLILAALAMLSGMAMSAAARSAIHEIEAFIFYLIAAVLFSAFSLLHAIISVRESVASQGAKLDAMSTAIATLRQQGGDPVAAPPPLLTGDDTYHVQVDSEVRGPFTHGQLKAMLERGLITPDSYVFPQGAPAWIRLSDLTA